MVDAASVITTHLSEVVRRHAAALLRRQDVQRLLDTVRREHPAVVDELVPHLLSLSEVHQVLQLLLEEQVPIRDLVTILEVLGNHARTVRNVHVLAEHVRHALAATITQQYVRQALVEINTQNENQAGAKAATAKTLSRKLTEARYALALEQKLSKDQILEDYLNTVYFGSGAYGIAAAAQHYFSEDPSQLTLPQAALLAGVVKALFLEQLAGLVQGLASFVRDAHFGDRHR